MHGLDIESSTGVSKESSLPDPRWKSLYRVGFVASIVLAVGVVLAVVLYFIWPYAPGTASVQEIFSSLMTNRFGALVSLDLSVPVLNFFLILQLLPLYIALKHINESYALIAVVIGVMGIAFFFISRPLVEMVYLSGRYSEAAGEAAQLRYLSAGEAHHALFDGTLWMLSQIFIAVSYFILSAIMLRSKVFSNTAGWMGMILTVMALGMFVPVFIVVAICGLGSTVISAVWDVFLARSFYRLGWRSAGEAEGEV